MTYGTQDRQLQAHAFPNNQGRTVPEKEMIMNCHEIDMQLERIRNAGIGAGAGFSSEGSSGLEEQLQIMESAIARIRDEMRRRSGVTRVR